MIDDHASLADGGSFVGPFLTEGELFGKSHFVCGVNPGRRRSILGKLRKINWAKVMDHAVEKELCRYRDLIAPRGSERPDCVEELPLVVSARRFREQVVTGSDDSVAPF